MAALGDLGRFIEGAVVDGTTVATGVVAVVVVGIGGRFGTGDAGYCMGASVIGGTGVACAVISSCLRRICW